MFLAVCCLSCSGGVKLNPVKGKLLYKNQPLPDATVSFFLVGGDITTGPSVGLTEEDGSFTLLTGEREGAPAGEYKVCVICPEEARSKAKRNAVLGNKPEFKDRFKGAYAAKDHSKISVQIKEGMNELQPINLE